MPKSALRHGRRFAFAAVLAAGVASAGRIGAAENAALDAIRHLHLDTYRLAKVDLDDDGRAEILVYATGAGWCGSGGCTLFVLRRDRVTYRVVSQSTIVWPPIRLLSSRSHGWHDLGVTVAGGGIGTPYEARLRYDGARYPLNPSIPPSERIPSPTGRVILG